MSINLSHDNYYKISSRMDFDYFKYVDKHLRGLEAEENLARPLVHLPVDEWKKQLKTTGCSYHDYAVLWEFIKQNTPQYFLELGPGVSSFVIASAMKEFCYDKYNGDIKLVCIEENQEWHNRLIKYGPKFDFVEMHRSDVFNADLLWFYGKAFKNIPDYAYDAVFIDGPNQYYSCSLDFLRILIKSRKPVTFLLDLRVSTAMVIFLMFGPQNLKRLGEELFQLGPFQMDDSDFDSDKRDSLSTLKIEEILLRMLHLLDEKQTKYNLLDAPETASPDEKLKGQTNDNASKIYQRSH